MLEESNREIWQYSPPQSPPRKRKNIEMWRLGKSKKIKSHVFSHFANSF
jgi:hypothetical protein